MEGLVEKRKFLQNTKRHRLNSSSTRTFASHSISRKDNPLLKTRNTDEPLVSINCRPSKSKNVSLSEKFQDDQCRLISSKTTEIQNEKLQHQSKSLENDQHQGKSSNLKRKRSDSPSNISLVLQNPPIDLLQKICLSFEREEFRGPSLSNIDDDHQEKRQTLRRHQNCSSCRKPLEKNRPSIKCDYCPLIYHIDCIPSWPSINEKWMCSNHFEPVFDRYFFRKKTISKTKRVKLFHLSSSTEPKLINQNFLLSTPNRKRCPSKTLAHPRPQPIEISQIPKTIGLAYSLLTSTVPSIDDDQTQILSTMPMSPILIDDASTTYDPCIWDILQNLVDHVLNIKTYEFSTVLQTDPTIVEKTISDKIDVHDQIELLLNALNQSDIDLQSKNLGIDFESRSERSILPIESIDVSRFRLSHAALIHLHSRQVIYIEKQVIWIGSTPLNDICLNDFQLSRRCSHVDERHACLYYDRKRNLFELLNYSGYGIVVDGLCYGLGQEEKLENLNDQQCSCANEPSIETAWDGAAQIEQGTVFRIGCHSFLFYRHVAQ